MNLFKHNRPVIRPFEFIKGDNPGDLPYIWDAYKEGLFKEAPENLSIDSFIEYSDAFMVVAQEMYMFEDIVNGVLTPIGICLNKNNGWQIEPHMLWFSAATPRTIYRACVAFLKHTKYRKDIGSCLIRVGKQEKSFISHFEKMGLLEYVGKVWGGTPYGNEYLYSVRCQLKNTQLKSNNTRH